MLNLIHLIIGRLSILSQWKLNIKMFEIAPTSFSPKPKSKVHYSFFHLKNFSKIKSKNLEKVTRVFLIKEEKC